MDTHSLSEAFVAGKNAIDLIRVGASLLSGTSKRDALEKATQAETALKSAQAMMAKKLGYPLCRCTFPPEITLFEREKNAHVCRNCGEVYSQTPQISRVSSSLLNARRGTC